MPTFLQSLRRLLNCSKVQVATTGLVSTWFAVRYAATDLPPTQRSALWVAFIGAVTVQLREIINAWTEEDIAKTQAQTNASPVNPNPNASAQPRNTAMPLRTKFPLVLVAFTIIAVGGCQTCPELAIYREGLHRIDEPLYQAHLLLLDDAVKANIRSGADRQVVQQGVAAARSLYQQAATTQPEN